MAKKRLLAITHELSATGAPIGLLSILSEMRDRFAITMASPIDGPLAEDCKSFDIPVVIEPEILRDPSIVPRLMQSYDILYANTLLCIKPVAATSETGKRIVWAIHEVKEWADKLDKMEALAKHAFAAAAEVVTTCNYAKDLYQRWRSKEIRVVPIGVKIRERLPDPVPHDGLHVLILGSVHPVKGQDIAYQAMKILDSPEYVLNIAGGVPARDFAVNLLNEHVGRSRVYWHGRVTNERKQQLMDATDVVLVPSRDELTNLSAHEAMEAGKVVVASCSGGLPEIICPAGFPPNGFLFNKEDSAGLAQVLKRIREVPGMADAVAKPAREFVKQHRTLKQWADGVAAWIDDAPQPP